MIQVDPNGVVHTLRHEAVDGLSDAGVEVVLDFTLVPRIDPNAVKAMEELADLADARSAKVVLRAVNIDIYKVLKLLKLTARFSFVS